MKISGDSALTGRAEYEIEFSDLEFAVFLAAVGGISLSEAMNSVAYAKMMQKPTS